VATTKGKINERAKDLGAKYLEAKDLDPSFIT